MSDSEDKGTLPYGWVVKTSKRYKDRVYYFNLSTGASTWECPELDPPCSDKTLGKSPLNLDSSKCVNSDKDYSKTPEEKQANKFDSNFSSETKTPPTAVVVPVMHKNSSSIIHKKEVLKRKLEDEPKIPVMHKNSSSIIHKKEVLKRKLEDEPKIEETPNSIKEKLNRKMAKRKKKEKLKKINSVKFVGLDTSKDAPAGKIDDVKNSSLEENLNSSSALEVNDDIKDVEMKDISLELDDLNVKTEVDASACYYIVVDTNVLIRELHLISELKDTPLDGCGPPNIFIPWVVIEELDKLKNQRNIIKSPWRAAVEAIRYLNSVLKNHPRFHGQSPAEAEEWSKSYSKNNDDKILECCEALMDKMPPEKVILLTNDKNLVNKALICKINVHDFESMMKKVKPDTVFVYNEKRKEKEKKLESDSVNTSISPEVAHQRFLRSSRDINKREIHNLMSNARLSLKDVLSEFLEIEMFEAYGEHWKHFNVAINLLTGILEAIKKYWRMVFSEFFSIKDQRNFELLLEKVKRPEGFMGDKDDCLVILSTIEDVFKQIQKRRPALRVPVDKIKNCRLACVQAFTKYNENEDSLRALEEIDTFKLFNANWICINQLTGLILDYYNISNNFDYVKFNGGRLPEAEVQRILITLLPEVEHIKTLMSHLLENSKNCKPTQSCSKKLAKKLVNFIPSLRVPHEPTTYPNFSQKALERFFLSSQHRGMIENGIKQADEFHKKLDEVLNNLLQCKIGNRDADTMVCD